MGLEKWLFRGLKIKKSNTYDQYECSCGFLTHWDVRLKQERIIKSVKSRTPKLTTQEKETYISSHTEDTHESLV